MKIMISPIYIHRYNTHVLYNAISRSEFHVHSKTIESVHEP